jgi:hypothetical protein
MNGCGNSGSATPTPNFTAKANTICAQINAKIEQLPTSNGSVQSVVTDTNGIIALGETEISQLGQLTAPRAEQATFQKDLAALRNGLPYARAMVADLVRHNLHAAQAEALKLEPLSSETNRASEQLGIGQCAKSVTPAGKAG